MAFKKYLCIWMDMFIPNCTESNKCVHFTYMYSNVPIKFNFLNSFLNAAVFVSYPARFLCIISIIITGYADKKASEVADELRSSTIAFPLEKSISKAFDQMTDADPHNMLTKPKCEYTRDTLVPVLT